MEDIMKLVLGGLWRKSNRWLKTGWLIFAGFSALYFGALQPRLASRGFRSEKVAGVDSAELNPIALWQAPLYERAFEAGKGQLGGTLEAIRMIADDSSAPQAPRAAMTTHLSKKSEVSNDRKIERSASLDLVTKDPADAAEKIRQLAELLGGYLAKSVTNGQDGQGAFLEVRVPAEHFEEACAEIRKLGLRVESERVEAEDVTRQYVDLDARLRNLRSEESQYLAIMKRANTVKDTLEVSEKLSSVRGQIEEQQAEFRTLTKQIETVAISVSLRTEADARVFGLNWRPLYQLKVAVREGLNSLGDYAAAMAAFFFMLPAILLWLMTILLGASAGWRIVRRASRLFFGWPQAATVNSGR
jgi:hypothetical protein